MREERWRERAACARIDPELWFPEAGCVASDAKWICNNRCPVREECAAAAGPRDAGVWGGTSVDRRPHRAKK